MTESEPILTLAIPVVGPEAASDLGHTLDRIAEIWSCPLTLVSVHIGSAKGALSDFPIHIQSHPVQPTWHFEADHGIYDAMNRLLRHCVSPRILFLGAGDGPLPGLRDAVLRWKHTDITPLELGGVQLPDAEPGVPQHYPARWDRSLLWRNSTHHQGMAYSTQLLRDHGGFDTRYKVLADYAVNLQWWLAGTEAHWKADEDWVAVSPGGISRRFDTALYAEEVRLKQDILPPGMARFAQPLWIALKSAKKRGLQRGA